VDVKTNADKPLRYFRSEWRQLSAIAVVSGIAAQVDTAALVLLVPLAQGVASKSDISKTSIGPWDFHGTTGELAGLSAACVVIGIVLNFVLSWQRARMMTSWELRQREGVLAEFLRADYPTQAAERSGTLDTLSGYTNRGSVALGSIASGLRAGLTVITFLVAALLIDVRAALAILLTGAAPIMLMRPAMTRTRKYSRRLAALQLEYNQELHETVRMARDIRIFAASGAVGSQLEGVSRDVAHVRRRSNLLGGIISPAYQYAGMLVIIVALSVAQATHLDVAALGAITLLLLRSLGFGQQLQGAHQTVVENMPFMQKLEDLRAVYIEHRTVDGTVPLEEVHTLEVDHASYSYDGTQNALEDISVSFQRGEIVGIVGPSGGGKSTLSQLLLRLRVPSSGRLLVNRMPADDFTLASYYRHVSLVPQDPRLLHGTVAQNIAFFDDSIPRDQVIEAAKDAGLHEAIMSLGEGYDTLVGPSFRDLSGGQIQRIGIARALARRADVLILDEPTSALDVHSEAVVQETLERQKGRALVVIIAHRLSTLSICDRIVVLAKGRVETSGSLSEVAESSDFFRRALDAGTLDVGLTDARNPAPSDDR
jgi:ABC-type multidrug transport system fused ATPase/permease subunit